MSATNSASAGAQTTTTARHDDINRTNITIATSGGAHAILDSVTGSTNDDEDDHNLVSLSRGDHDPPTPLESPPSTVVSQAMLNSSNLTTMTTATNNNVGAHNNMSSLNITPAQNPMTSSSFKFPVAQQLFDLSTSITNNPWKIKLLSRLADVVELCGELCNINSVADYEKYIFRRKSTRKNPWFSTLKIPLPDCPSILRSPLLDVADSVIPFPIPSELMPYYSWNDDIVAKSVANVSQVYAGGDAFRADWDVAWVQNWTQQAAAGTLEGNYGYEDTRRIRAALEMHGNIRPNVTSVLVIGSETPWVEAICLSLGVKHVTTLEYGAIVSHHDQISTMTPDQIGERVLRKKNNATTASGDDDDAAATDEVVLQFDLVVTYSSVEHSGLGRYGDALNPWGDLLAMTRAACLLKPQGRMLIGVPTGKDRVEFNRHRIYGDRRYPILTNYFRLLNVVQLREWGFAGRLRKPRKSNFQYPLMLERIRAS